MNFVLLSGSFQAKSRSLALLKTIQGLLADHDSQIPNLEELAFYNEDLQANPPLAVQTLLAEIGAADGLIVCSPEYNHSIPAVLKNAIDWVSRPAFHSVLKDKPVTFITQAVSPVGGARAQAHLKLVFDSTLARIHPCHEMLISQVDTIFDEQMTLVDEKVLNRLQRHCEQFVTFSSQ